MRLKGTPTADQTTGRRRRLRYPRKAERDNVIYQVAEKFKSIQGEGVYAGTPMAFIRFVGCSVGKTICQHCDTDFDKQLTWRGGGTFSPNELFIWSQPDYQHICLTGGEPLNQDLSGLFACLLNWPDPDGTGYAVPPPYVHIETSGTCSIDDRLRGIERSRYWLCVSPKPGFREEVVQQADEVKVIAPGLGNGSGWPQLGDALRWADMGKIVFLQPRNGKYDVDKQNLLYVQDLIRDYPQLRLSVQMHKVLHVQ